MQCKNRGILKKKKDEILNLWNSGISANEIARIIGVPYGPMYKALRGFGIVDKTLYNTDPILNNKILDIQKLFNQNKSYKEISKELNIQITKLKNFMIKNNMEIPYVIYDVDETFFDIIDTEEKAYCLGMWFSDGNVHKNGYYITIELNEKDKDVLDKIKSCIKYTGPLIYYCPKTRTNNRGNSYILTISSKKLSMQLVKHGCTPNKSLSLDFPTCVPNHLLNHFIRGLFDGDGSISKNGNCTFSGSYKLIYKLKDILPCGYDRIFQGTKNRLPEESFHQLFIWQKIKCRKFLEWLYKDATIYLNRKRNRYGVLYLCENHDINNY